MSDIKEIAGRVVAGVDLGVPVFREELKDAELNLAKAKADLGLATTLQKSIVSLGFNWDSRIGFILSYKGKDTESAFDKATEFFVTKLNAKRVDVHKNLRAFKFIEYDTKYEAVLELYGSGVRLNLMRSKRV